VAIFSTTAHFRNQDFEFPKLVVILIPKPTEGEKNINMNCVYVTKDLYAVFDIQRRYGNILTSTCKDPAFHGLSLRTPSLLLFNDVASIEVTWRRL
jgi:hypothetical protein